MKIHLHHKYGFVSDWNVDPRSKVGMSCSYNPAHAMQFSTVNAARIARMEIAEHMSWQPSEIVVLTGDRSHFTVYPL